MIARVRVTWPASSGAVTDPPGWRLLAVSDEIEPSLERQENRDALPPVDLVVGCGDLDPTYLAMLGDAFRVPLLYVRGNHDRGLGWQAASPLLPEPLIDAQPLHVKGLELVGLSWPGDTSGHADRDERAAWRQVLRRGLMPRRRSQPCLVVSHAPPDGAGDDPDDEYHRGFPAYRWLAGRLKPVLWLHGHTTVAARSDRIVDRGATRFVNVTGATLVELVPATSPAAAARD
jgi:hypothetical protein